MGSNQYGGRVKIQERGTKQEQGGGVGEGGEEGPDSDPLVTSGRRGGKQRR